LRILDSKEEGDRKIVAGAPQMAQHMTPAASDYFAQVMEGLAALGIEAHRNERLVRGLDYYNHTVFEFTTDLLGAQGTVLAGGRYDGLIELMGGPKTCGIGWAAGIERLTSLMEWNVKQARPVALIPLGDAAEKEALRSAAWMRKEGYTVELAYKGNLGNRMKKANRANAIVALIFGDNELAKQVVAFKNLDSGEQKEIPLAELMSALAPYRDQH
jgi:histidyl-tRNA synthetase